MQLPDPGKGLSIGQQQLHVGQAPCIHVRVCTYKPLPYSARTAAYASASEPRAY